MADGKRRKIQGNLAFEALPEGEAPRHVEGRAETSGAGSGAESPAGTTRLMEEVLAAENLRKALKRVQSNKGSAGVDGMSVTALPGFLKEHWPRIREELLAGCYKPQPVKRVQIPKPDGGERGLGIPTVLDRFIQQALLQVFQPLWEPDFSDHSYGFRPGRSAHQAVARAQGYIAEGYRIVVDMDLEKFFDRVNHDDLMNLLARRVGDKRVLKLVRGYLNAGVLENGLVKAVGEGTPQGGPLSPLLSNIVLDRLDQELERRGHRFVRYADDCNVYVKSERAGQRVLESIGAFIEEKLRLKLNREKSAVGRPTERKFLGFSFTGGKEPKRRIAPKALNRLKARIAELTRRTRGVSLERMTKELAQYLIGWRGYFGFCQTPSVLKVLDGWIRRRLRSVLWKQWKRGRIRYRELRDRGVSKALAAQTAGSSHGPWRISKSPALSVALPNAFFTRLGLPALAPG
jgi:RNA-directed DNA polymerase